jgi:hypothetical protein
MKLVAVSVVKNEADMIEAFVRHTAAYVDQHLIFDHDSTDGTREILFELVREGLPLKLFTGDAVANLQQNRSNHLARRAFESEGADWVLPLDADEILVVRDRRELERLFTNSRVDQPVSVCLRNYSPTPIDAVAELNPVLRIQHRQRGPGSTNKVFVPRQLGLRTDVAAGKGNHALYCGAQILPAATLPDVWLAHFALRGPHQQVLRVVTAELQKLSRGQAHEGLDLHYRLGFQLLAEDADLFFSTVLQPPSRLKHDPAPYRGGALRYPLNISPFARSARALVPFLEKLARSHGRLVDGGPVSTHADAEMISALDVPPRARRSASAGEAFVGFTALDGWQPEEGPIPEAFLPRFHWATGPSTSLVVTSDVSRSALLEAEVLTYAEQQETIVTLNDVELTRFRFPRVNQKETFAALLDLRAGENRLTFHHARWLESAADPRKLALIFLSLRIVHA